MFVSADEWTEYFNPPDYDRDQYDGLERNPKLKRTSMIKCGKKPAEVPDCTNGCLFNIRNDPCEYNDLSERKNELFEELKAKLENYKKEMTPPRYKHDEDPNANPRNHGGVWSPWVDAEGEPVEHKPLPPGEKLPGQEEPKPSEEKPAEDPAQASPTQAPPQAAPSQEAMKLAMPGGVPVSRRHRKNDYKVNSLLCSKR